MFALKEALPTQAAKPIRMHPYHSGQTGAHGQDFFCFVFFDASQHPTLTLTLTLASLVFSLNYAAFARRLLARL